MLMAAERLGGGSGCGRLEPGGVGARWTSAVGVRDRGAEQPASHHGVSFRPSDALAQVFSV
jgi:hypothetical protein